MLAEHLQDSRPLFASLANHCPPDGVFFSTALESAQRDHTFEFHHESEPVKMAEEVGSCVARLVSDAGLLAPGAFSPACVGHGASASREIIGPLVGLEGVMKAVFSDNEETAIQTPGRRPKV